MLPIALLLTNTVLAGSLRDLDQRNGFRDLSLGSSCSDVADFSTEGTPDRDLVSYVRNSDILQVGEAQLQSVVYSCYQDALSQVRIIVIGEDNQQTMMDALVEAYGEPSAIDEEANSRTWTGGRVLLETFTAPVSDTLVVCITSQELLAQRLQDVIDAKAAAIEDL